MVSNISKFQFVCVQNVSIFRVCVTCVSVFWRTTDGVNIVPFPKISLNYYYIYILYSCVYSTYVYVRISIYRSVQKNPQIPTPWHIVHTRTKNVNLWRKLKLKKKKVCPYSVTKCTHTMTRDTFYSFTMQSGWIYRIYFAPPSSFSRWTW